MEADQKVTCQKPDRQGGLVPNPLTMKKADYVDFKKGTEPLAYLITFRCYGSWLHGDQRGSIDRKHYHRYGTPAMSANEKLLEDERSELKHTPVKLKNAQRIAVEEAIREVCEHRSYYFVPSMYERIMCTQSSPHRANPSMSWTALKHMQRDISVNPVCSAEI